MHLLYSPASVACCMHAQCQPAQPARCTPSTAAQLTSVLNACCATWRSCAACACRASCFSAISRMFSAATSAAKRLRAASCGTHMHGVWPIHRVAFTGLARPCRVALQCASKRCAVQMGPVAVAVKLCLPPPPARPCFGRMDAPHAQTSPPPPCSGQQCAVACSTA